jgi:hypothetical protein
MTLAHNSHLAEHSSEEAMVNQRSIKRQRPSKQLAQSMCGLSNAYTRSVGNDDYFAVVCLSVDKKNGILRQRQQRPRLRRRVLKLLVVLKLSKRSATQGDVHRH